jgi:hypothetical protein
LRLCLAKKSINELVKDADSNEKIRSGNPIPKPNEMKVTRFSKKPIVDNVVVKSAAINNGLHGITIAPKKNPKRRALNLGSFEIGVLILGSISPMFMFRINIMLITRSKLKAMGEITPITLVSDT